MIALSLLVAFAGAVETSEVGEPVLLMKLSCASDEICPLFDGSLAEALSTTPNVDVLTFEDIKQMADLESEVQASGCDEMSCMAEIANALGARKVLYGSATQVGETWVVQLVLLNAYEARAELRGQVRGEGALETADALKVRVREWFGSPVEVVEAPAEPLPWGLIGASGVTALGVVFAVVGGVGVSGAQGSFDAARDPGLTAAARKTEIEAAQSVAWVWTAVAVTGLVVAAAGGVWLGAGLAE